MAARDQVCYSLERANYFKRYSFVLIAKSSNGSSKAPPKYLLLMDYL